MMQYGLSLYGHPGRATSPENENKVVQLGTRLYVSHSCSKSKKHRQRSNCTYVHKRIHIHTHIRM